MTTVLACHVIGCDNECVHASLEPGNSHDMTDLMCDTHIAELTPSATKWPWRQGLSPETVAQLEAVGK